MTDRYDGYATDQLGGASGSNGQGSADTAAIRADIRQTRERMSHTVEDIGDRLNPQRLKAQIKHNIHDATIGKAEHMARVAYDRVDETRNSIMDNIRDNPVPAAMVGIGLGWLLLGSRRHDDRTVHHVEFDRFSGTEPRYYTPVYDDGALSSDGAGAKARLSDLGETTRERAEEITHRAQDRVTGIAHDARETVHNATDRAHDLMDTGRDRARSMAGEFRTQTRMQTHRMEDRFDEALHESPLAVGAAAMALGLALGLSAPPTRRESELMGARRDALLDRAREKTSDLTERVQHVADRVVEQAESTVREGVREQGFT
jgi:ElaB/YqjD/DUF883 family membrane-anchored ribosome-binding protein